MGLVTLKDVKGYLGIEPGVMTADDLLNRLIEAASTWFETVTHREIKAKDYVEFYDGDGSTSLTPLNYPIISVVQDTGLKIGGVAVPAWTEEAPLGYVIEKSRIELVDESGVLVFTRGKHNVKLSYKANFATVPADIVEAIVELVAWRYREKDRPGQMSQSGANTTVSFSMASAPASVRDVIDAYANVQRIG